VTYIKLLGEATVRVCLLLSVIGLVVHHVHRDVSVQDQRSDNTLNFSAPALIAHVEDFTHSNTNGSPDCVFGICRRNGWYSHFLPTVGEEERAMND
jgi:hypothetical protein